MDIRYEGGSDEPNLAVTEMLNTASQFQTLVN